MIVEWGGKKMINVDFFFLYAASVAPQMKPSDWMRKKVCHIHVNLNVTDRKHEGEQCFHLSIHTCNTMEEIAHHSLNWWWWQQESSQKSNKENTGSFA